jgi:hypothetical protein
MFQILSVGTSPTRTLPVRQEARSPNSKNLQVVRCPPSVARTSEIPASAPSAASGAAAISSFGVEGWVRTRLVYVLGPPVSGLRRTVRTQKHCNSLAHDAVCYPRKVQSSSGNPTVGSSSRPFRVELLSPGKQGMPEDTDEEVLRSCKHEVSGANRNDSPERPGPSRTFTAWRDGRGPIPIPTKADLRY